MVEDPPIEEPGNPPTLSRALHGSKIAPDRLLERHKPLLALVRLLIGVVPNCDAYLEIWPTAFRSYNVMVPNLLNVPFLLWGDDDFKRAVGLTMYASSRSAGCAYCSAHCCTFAMRRGSGADQVVAAMSADKTPLSAAEQAAVAVAAGMASVPPTLTREQCQELRRRFPEDQVEWLVLAAAMMGFLNKFMDAMGIDLEESVVAEVGSVISPTGWSAGRHQVVPSPFDEPGSVASSPEVDSAALTLKLLPNLPAALARDKKWTAGVPGKWPAAGHYLNEHVGYSFPVLSTLTPKRVIRSISTMIRDNCRPEDSQIGLQAKHLAGLVFGEVVGDPELAEASRQLARRAAPDTGHSEFDAAARLSHGPTIDTDEGLESALQDLVDAGLERPAAAALLLARGAAPSPAEVSPALVGLAAREMAAPAVIELMVWPSVLQMLHRLNVFFETETAD